jgi:hypothetical protein
VRSCTVRPCLRPRADGFESTGCCDDAPKSNAELRHRPWEATPEEAAAAGLVLGDTYPAPMVDPADQIGEGPKPLNRG